MFITNNFDNFLKADQASDKITINGKLRKWQIYHSDFKTGLISFAVGGPGSTCRAVKLGTVHKKVRTAP